MSGYTYMLTNDDGEPLGFETIYPDEAADDVRDEYDEAPDLYDEDEMSGAEFYAEAEMSRYDDDPSPYDGNYSEE